MCGFEIDINVLVITPPTKYLFCRVVYLVLYLSAFHRLSIFTSSLGH